MKGGVCASNLTVTSWFSGKFVKLLEASYDMGRLNALKFDKRPLKLYMNKIEKFFRYLRERTAILR